VCSIYSCAALKGE